MNRDDYDDVRQVTEVLCGRSDALSAAEVLATVLGWSHDGAIAKLQLLGMDVAEDPDDHYASPPILGTVIEQLSRPGTDRIAAAAQLGHHLQVYGRPLTLRKLAAMTAAGHSMPDAMTVLAAETNRYSEFWALVVHEYVVRGHDLRDDATVLDFQRTLQASRHPLGFLPLHLLPVERLIRKSVAGELNWETEIPAETAVPLGAAHRVATFGQRCAITSAFYNWDTAEAEVYATEHPLDLEAIDGAAVRDFMAGVVGWKPPAHVVQVPLDVAIRFLYVAAEKGGTYEDVRNSGAGGAYGRRAAWQSIAGLTGADLDTLESVSSIASQCQWWYIGWQGTFPLQRTSFAVFHPDKRTVYVVKAEDSD